MDDPGRPSSPPEPHSVPDDNPERQQWNSSVVDYLRQMLNTSTAHIWLHYNASLYFFRHGWYLQFLHGVCTAMLAGLTIVQNATQVGGGGCTSATCSWLLAGTVILSMASIVLNIVMGIINYPQRSEQHRMCSSSYAAVSQRIRTQLMFDHADRDDVHVVAEVANNEMFHLLQDGPLLPRTIVQNYKAQASAWGDLGGANVLPDIISPAKYFKPLGMSAPMDEAIHKAQRSSIVAPMSSSQGPRDYSAAWWMVQPPSHPSAIHSTLHRLVNDSMQDSSPDSRSKASTVADSDSAV